MSAAISCLCKKSDMQRTQDRTELMLKYFFLFSLTLASNGIIHAGAKVSISGALEPAFYSTGDYQSKVRTLSLPYWPTPYLGIVASAGKFDFFQDRLAWYTSVQVEVYGLEALARTKEWHRQRLEFGFGYTRQHKRADETFLEIATKDSAVIQRFQSGYMNTPHEELLTKNSDFRMRTAVRDANGYYRVGVSQVRDYSLNGLSTYLTYSARLFGDVWAQISPKVRYYRSEPLYIWSVSCGLSIPLIPG